MTTTSLSLEFAFQGHQVRVLGTSDDPWFIAKDVCDILELSDPDQAVRRLEEDEKLTRTIHGSGQARDMWTINESGLYSLIFTSRKPQAKAFKKWVTSEVLPSIRKTGSYQIPSAAPQLSSAEMLLAQAQLMVDYERRLKEQQLQLEAQASRIDTIEQRTNAGQALLEASPAPSTELPTLDPADEVRRLVNAFALGTNNDQRVIWDKLYTQAQYHLRRTPKKEYYLDADGNKVREINGCKFHNTPSKLNFFRNRGLGQQLYDLAYHLMAKKPYGRYSDAWMYGQEEGVGTSDTPAPAEKKPNKFAAFKATNGMTPSTIPSVDVWGY